MADLKLVTYCGLYCGLCANCTRIPRQALNLRDSMHKESVEVWGANLPDFNEFWRFLGGLAGSESRCSCRAQTCGAPFCTIRKCALEKKVEICPFCSKYPCERIAGLAKGYVMMLADGKRMKEIGLDKWIAEQEERKAKGFAYCDIRCQPYDVPDK